MAQNKPPSTNQNPERDVPNIGQPIRCALPVRLKSPELYSCVNVSTSQNLKVLVFWLSY